MTTLQPPSSSRPLSAHNVVLGVAIGLAILCAAITLVVVLERQRSEPELGSAIARLDEAREELRSSAKDLREATAALQAATRAPTTINVMSPPPSASTSDTLRALETLSSSLINTSPEPAPALPSLYCPEPERCSIPRAVIDEMLANPADFAKQARIIPSLRDGVARGFKLYGIRPDSLPKNLGFKNGDMVTSVNGLPLTGMDQAMTAYTQLRRVDKFVLELERKGELLRKEITIN